MIQCNNSRATAARAGDMTVSVWSRRSQENGLVKGGNVWVEADVPEGDLLAHLLLRLCLLHRPSVQQVNQRKHGDDYETEGDDRVGRQAGDTGQQHAVVAAGDHCGRAAH